MVKKVKKTKEKNAEMPQSKTDEKPTQKIETVVVEEVAEVAENMEKPAVAEKPAETTASSIPEPEMQEEIKKPEEPFIPMDEPKSRLPMVLFFFTIVIVTAVAAGGGMFLYLQIKDNKISVPHIPRLFPTPTPISQGSTGQASTPTPTTVDISKFTIEVLNGSGISGAAAQAKSLLTTAGFSVSDVGNSPTSDFTKTIIATKKSIDPNFLQKLKDTLQKTYVLGDTTTLSDTDATAHDVVVTIGSQKQ